MLPDIILALISSCLPTATLFQSIPQSFTTKFVCYHVMYSTYIFSIFNLFESISSEKAVPNKEPVGLLKPVERLAEEIKL